ncbi:MAG: TIR domain-containing protein [Lachnospiraceae bacterium]|nr:TIR domain-containing protein [Candidatus Equihabitans merdae]
MNDENTMPVAYKGNEPSIFISYSHRDSGRIFPILRKMMGDGFRIWFDEGIDPGTEWDQNIATHVKTCSYFIAFISANYIASDNCRDELSYARDLQKDRLLIYLEPTDLPDGLMMRLNRTQAIHWYNYNNALDRAYIKLYDTAGIDRCREIKPEPVVEPEPAPVVVAPAAPAAKAVDTPAPVVKEETPAVENVSTPVSEKTASAPAPKWAAKASAEKKAKPVKQKKVKEASGNGKKKSKKGLIAIPIVIILAVVLFIGMGGKSSKSGSTSTEDRFQQMTNSATWTEINQKAEPVEQANPVVGVWTDRDPYHLGTCVVMNADGTGTYYTSSDDQAEDFNWEAADTTLVITRNGNEDYYAYEGGDELEIFNRTFVRSTMTVDEAVELWQNHDVLYKAFNYASYEYGYSRDEVIDHLLSYDFTEEEAAYGIDYWNVDWNAQAVRGADYYCANYKDHSREKVIEYLRNKGYSLEQATYGADNCQKVKK